MGNGKFAFKIATSEATVWIGGILALVLVSLMALDGFKLIELNLGILKAFVLITFAIVMVIEALFETPQKTLTIPIVAELVVAFLALVMALAHLFKLEDVTALFSGVEPYLYVVFVIALAYELFFNRK